MGCVFISYRRDDSPDTVARIYQALTAQLPNQKIFRDIDGIPLGKEFPDLLREKLAEATTILVIIGPRWLEILKQRATAPVDHVRDEIRIALESQAEVIPVTVGGAKMTSETDLADFPALLPLTRRNGTPVRPDPDFVNDVDRLVKAIADPATGESVGAVLGGKYKLLRKIGEGGMGTVFVAQQAHPVRRQVAVKLIKLGMDTKEVLARFDAEKQALAVMDHPNIAGVLDAGMTLLGRPFFVMELVQGKPITEFCDSKKLPPRERLELFKAVCHAVQHAHQKGIIHRDIKPSNVLVEVIDSRPVPKVIDFGLAKAMGQKLTDKTIYSESGLRIGTLEYMSPEQAEANHFDIDTRSDIYSLGVLLYELLTGNPPFSRQDLEQFGDDRMRQVIREVDPPIPSSRLSSSNALPIIAANRNLEPAKLTKLVRGELDWIVMKSLEKDRTRRYETATGLARDVERYLADEVVEARPPSVRYRVRKFLRKHRGPVVAASLVLLALVGGIAGTTWGFFRAEDEAENARRREGDATRAEGVAKKNEADAIVARNELGKANTALQESTDRLLSTAARSLLRPLALQVQPNQPLPPLNDQEIEPLWELASTKEEPLRFRFVEVALQDPVSTRRLKDRSAVALHAAVGLDRERRTRVETLLGKCLLANEIPLEQRENVALCLAQLGNLDRHLATTSAQTLTPAFSKTADSYTLRSFSESLLAVTARMEPRDAAQKCAQAAASLTQAMSKTANSYDLSKRANSDDLKRLSEDLSAVVARMEPRDAAQKCAQAAVTLTQAMSKTTDTDAMLRLSEGLLAVAARMEPKEATVTLTQAICGKNWDTQRSLREGLLAVSTRMEPKDAAATLTQEMSKTTDSSTRWSLSEVLLAVSTRMEPKDAAATLTQVMSKSTNWNALLELLSTGLSAVAARMEPKDAAHVCAQATVTLTQAMSKTTDSRDLMYLLEGLSAIAARMEPKEAAITLTQEMSKTTNTAAMLRLSEALSAVTGRMEPKEAAQVCAQATVTLTQAMSKTTYPSDLIRLSEALSVVAARMEPKEAAHVYAQAAVTLTQAISKPRIADTLETMSADIYALGPLSKGLSAVAAHMEPKEAAQVCAQAAVTLTQAISKTKNSYNLGHLSVALSMVAAHMEPKEAAQVCAQAAVALTQAISKLRNADTLDALKEDIYALRPLSEGLLAVAAHMEPKEAAHACAQAAATFTQAIHLAPGLGALQSLWEDLLRVAAHMEPKKAAVTLTQVMSTLKYVMIWTPNSDALQSLPKGLTTVAARMEPVEAVVTLTKAMIWTPNSDALRSLSKGLAAIATRMEPKEAAQAAVTLAQAMS